MSLTEQLAKEHADHDPHGFKARGENTPRHAFKNEPYTHQQFPQVVYKPAKVGHFEEPKTNTKTVADETELAAALADGWSETPKPENDDPPAEPSAPELTPQPASDGVDAPVPVDPTSASAPSVESPTPSATDGSAPAGK